MVRPSLAVATSAVAVFALAVLLGTSSPRARRPALANAASSTAVRRVVLGRSALGRPIEAWQVGAAHARAGLLVVGAIHGNEPAGGAVAASVPALLARASVAAWIVPNLNPDGQARGTRQNARGVDLNRNFPYRWRPLGRPGDLQYSGRRPLSEPEARVAYRLVLRVRPRIAVWFHQPLAVVDESGGSRRIESRFSRLSGLPLRRLTRYPGSAVGWENHAVPGSTAFVVELPPGRLSHNGTSRLEQALLDLVAGRGR